MARDARKRQKQLERKKSKRKQKQQALVRRQPQSLADRLERAAQAPVLHAAIAEAVWKDGIGSVLLSRALSEGRVAFAVFLVDRFCLGVKDAFGNIVPRSDYLDEFYPNMSAQQPLEAAEPACARKLVEGAVAYARDLGLAPHPDYRRTAPIFGDIDPSLCTQEFEYGRDGKPYFMAGPYDSPARCRSILNTLHDRLGPDGYHFLLPMPGPFGGIDLLDDEGDVEHIELDEDEFDDEP